MTIGHTNDSIGDALDFFLCDAYPDETYAPTGANVALAISIASADWNSAIKKYLDFRLHPLRHKSFGDAIAYVSARSTVMSFGIYLVGYIILIVGLAMGAHLMHMPTRWIGVGVVVMIGIGVISGVTATRNRDSSS
jgi:hypothetical protein